jgi:TonB family protein
VPTTRAGSPFGSQYDGITVGHEVKPALPVSGDRPSVSRSELPNGVQGDVIVEITIDVQGNVVQTKLLKTIGYGIDQKVLATLQTWHFTPAMQDGVAIPSQQDVYFHFPG